MYATDLRMFLNNQEIKRGSKFLIPINVYASYSIPDIATRFPEQDTFIRVRHLGNHNEYKKNIQNETGNVIGIYTGIRDAMFMYVALIKSFLDISAYGLDAYKYYHLLDSMCIALFGNSEYDICAMSMKKKFWEKLHPDIKSYIINHFPDHHSIIVPTQWTRKLHKNFFNSAYEWGWYSITDHGKIIKSVLSVQKSKNYVRECHLDGLIVPIMQIPLYNPLIKVNKWTSQSETLFEFNLK